MSNRRINGTTSVPEKLNAAEILGKWTVSAFCRFAPRACGSKVWVLLNAFPGFQLHERIGCARVLPRLGYLMPRLGY